MRSKNLAASCAAFIAFATLAACSSSSSSGRNSTSGSRTSAVSAATPSGSSPATRATTVDLGIPNPDPDSPAIVKFGRADVVAALKIAGQLAHASITDQTLLTVGPHQNIADYAAVTRYLDQPAIRALIRYIGDQTHNEKDLGIASGLATAAVKVRNLHGGDGRHDVGATSLTFPDFAPYGYRAHIDPTVNVTGRYMVVTGTCSVRIPAVYNGKRKTALISHAPFRYSFTTAGSQAGPVGVDAWDAKGSLRFVNP